MKSAGDLFDLIRSLSPSEKGYFKKYVAKGANKKYVMLFNAINCMKQFDDIKLKKKFNKQLSNLSAAKAYLYYEILEALRAFDKSELEFVGIHRWLEYSNQLYDRKLFTQMPDVLQKGLSYARKCGSPEYILIYEAELRKVYIILDDYEKLEEFIETGYQEHLKTVELVRTNGLSNLLQVLIIKLNEFPRGIDIRSTLPQTIDKIERLIKQLQYPSGSKVIDRKIVSSFISFYKCINDDTKAYAFAKQNFEDYFYNYSEREGSTINALTAYSNYLVMCRTLCFDNILTTLPGQINNIISVSGYPNYKVCHSIFMRNEFLNALYFQIMEPSRTDDILVVKINQWLQQSQYISKGHRSAFHLQFAKLLFMRGRFSKAFYYLNEVARETKGEDPLYYKTALLLQLLIYFDTQDMENLTRFFPKVKMEIESIQPTIEEAVLLRFFSEYIRNKPEYQSRNKLTELEIELKNIEAEGKEKSMLSLFPFHAWLRSKIERRGIKDVFLEWKKQKQNSNAKKVKEVEQELGFMNERQKMAGMA